MSEEPAVSLDEYATVPIAFEVTHVVAVIARAGAFTLAERRLQGNSYTKDYDAIPREGPRHWAEHFDLSNWGA